MGWLQDLLIFSGMGLRTLLKPAALKPPDAVSTGEKPCFSYYLYSCQQNLRQMNSDNYTITCKIMKRNKVKKCKIRTHVRNSVTLPKY